MENFRNIESQFLEFDDGINIFAGQNAQGKTNIIEALWLFATCKSFRPAKDKDFIMFGREKSVIKTEFSKNDRNFKQEIRFFEQKKKELFKNKVKVKPSELIGGFTAVLFFPEHLNLVKSGPEERRKFLDLAISQVKPRYYDTIGEYNKVLAQRNYLLKSQRDDIMETLDVWDIKLSKLGAIIAVTRESYLKKMEKSAGNVLSEISSGRENLKLRPITFCQSDIREEKEEELYKLLKDSLNDDLRYGYTSFGPHRDDFLVEINDLAARVYASQGQQRSCVMSMKLAEAEILKEVTEEYPIMLFDDVFSELDSYRKSYITEKIKGKQVFITTCEECEETQKFDSSKIFRVSGGKVWKA